MPAFRDRSFLLLAAAMALAAPGDAAAREVWHTTRPLLPGDMLRAQDIEASEPQRDHPYYIDAERDIVGLEVKRRLRANAPIADRYVGERDLVRASQPVRVFWKSNGVTLEMEGRALESGGEGDEVRIHNPESGRTIRARVVAEGTAEVRGRP